MTLRQPGQVEKLLLQLLIFLIPSNLAYHFSDSSAFIRGRLVDYLIPRIYLSDLLVWTLITLFVLNIIRSRGVSSMYSWIIKHWLLLLILLYLFVISATSIASEAGIWFWFKLLQMFLLTFYLTKSYSIAEFLKLAFFPLFLTLVFQFTLGMYQFISQSSLMGFYLLGESLISSGLSVSGNFFGSILLLPYGSTPHPNVLAGLFTIYTLMILLCAKYNPNLSYYNVIKYISICLSIIIILLTQSLSALLGLVIGVIFLNTNITSFKQLIFRLVSFITLSFGLILASLAYHSTSFIDLYSIARRYMLFLTSFQLLKLNLLTGVGLNNFVPASNLHSLAQDSAIFLQPVHNIYLLWTTETGLIGLFLLIWGIYLVFRRHTPSIKHFSLFIPLLAMLLIGLFDHYPLTLQSGILLFATTIYISLAKNTHIR